MSLTSRRTAMARKRYKPEEIVAKLRQVDVLISQGQNMGDAIRQIGGSEGTFYRWRQEVGGRRPSPRVVSLRASLLIRTSARFPKIPPAMVSFFCSNDNYTSRCQSISRAMVSFCRNNHNYTFPLTST